MIPDRHQSSYFVIPDSDVGGGTTSITLTTGFNLSSIPNGATFLFNPTGSSNNNATINVDGLGAFAVQKSDGNNGTEPATANDLRPNAQVVFYATTSPQRFHLQVGIAGTGAQASVGTSNGDLAELGSNGRFAVARMPANVLTNITISANDRTLFGVRADGSNVQIGLGSRYALLAGSTFTGEVHGITAGDSDDSDLFATTAWVRDHLTANPSNGSARYFGIPDSDVGGSGNAITLSTGQDISALRNGDTFFFRSADGVTGSVQIAVDSLNSRSVRISNGSGGSQNLQGDEWTSNDPVTVVYESTANQFFLAGTRVGIAAFKNTGAGAGDIPLLGGGGRLSAQRLPTVAALTSGRQLHRRDWRA